jgi:hypothetical protein
MRWRYGVGIEREAPDLILRPAPPLGVCPEEA